MLSLVTGLDITLARSLAATQKKTHHRDHGGHSAASAATEMEFSVTSVVRSVSTRSSRRLCGLSVECFWPQRARRVCKLHSSTRRKSSRPEERVDVSNTEYGRPTRPASVLFTDLLGPKSLCENTWIPAYAGMTRVGIGRLSPAMSPPRRRGSILGNREARVFHTDS